MRDVEAASRRRQARRQAIGLGVAVLVAAGLGVWLQRTPAGRAALKIPVGELRSQAAALALLESQAGDPAPPRFVRAQATQLAKAVDNAREQLRSMPVEPALEPTRRAAGAAGDALAAAVGPWRSGIRPTAPPAAASATAARDLRGTLQAIEDSLGD